MCSMKKKDLKWEIASGEQISVKVQFESYNVNGTLAVLLCGEDDFEEVITTNLRESILLPENVQFVDANNFPEIGEWLERNEVASPVGITVRSGFCQYPAYYFKK